MIRFAICPLVGMLLTVVSLSGAASAAAATLKVNTHRDELARHGRCSLREAVTAVDRPGVATGCGRAGRRSNTIVLRGGRYTLSIAPSRGDGNSSGDLNVTGKGRVTIVGAGRTRTVIDATGLGDRVLSIAATASVTLRRLTVTGGHLVTAVDGSRGTGRVSCSAASGSGHDAAGAGGGIYNSGALALRDVAVIANAAAGGGAGGVGGSQSAAGGCRGGSGGQVGSGGGIYNQGKLTLVDSTVRANRAGAGGAGGVGGRSFARAGGSSGAGGPGGSGGGIYNQGRLLVTASTIAGNRAGRGGSGGGIFSAGGALIATNSTFASDFAGAGGDGGAIEIMDGAGRLHNATVADNGVGTGGSGGGLFVQSARPADDVRLQNTIVASNAGSNCASNTPSAIANGGHDLSYGDKTCPGQNGNPKLGRLEYNGGPTATLALRSGSAAINRVPVKGAHCPGTDQRGVRRPQGKACDVGAFEFARPTIKILSPRHHGSYERGARILARFRCSEGGITSPIAACKATVPHGHAINTRSVGAKLFRVTATDKTGHTAIKTIHYTVWEYVNPIRAVHSLSVGRIDMGVDYVGYGPLLALGNGRVTFASNHDSGPVSCWGRTCWPGGGAVVYRLSAGPFAGKYVYVAENITVTVRVGQKVRAGQRIAILHDASPYMETGWASGHGPETLAIADGHQCRCGDPGGWSTIEGRNFDRLLIALGAPSGYLQPNAPKQRMPRGWPRWPRPRHSRVSIPDSPRGPSARTRRRFF